MTPRVMADRRRRPIVPLIFLLLAGLIAVVALPSTLRPPPDQATSSAALDPDAPPDEADPDAIISSFQQAGSATAGAQTSTETTATTLSADQEATAGAGGATKPKPVTTGRFCFGTPPRQIESIYAAECKPAFVGDNGGATYKNVRGDLVRIGYWHALGMPGVRGPQPFEPPPNESSQARTARVLQDFFNQRIETYGRRIQLVAIEQENREEATEKAAAAKADEQFKVFASTHLDKAFCDEVVRRQLVCYSQNGFKDSIYRAADGRFFGLQMGIDKNDQLAAEFVCRRLRNGVSEHAGVGSEDLPRKFGIIYQNLGGRASADLRARLRSTCGVEAIGFDVKDPTVDRSEAQNISLAITQLRQQGVTTVVIAAELVAVILAMQQADAISYFPEWVNIGSYGIDINIIGSTLPKAQAEHLFGMSWFELARPAQQTDCFIAYKTIDPNNDPDTTWCGNFFLPLLQILNGISNAGPRLTAKSFADGLFRFGENLRIEKYAIQGGYAPGDYSYVDKMGEVWWDPTATAPGGAQGAYRWTGDARRYGLGEIPQGRNGELFVSGVLRGDT